VKLFPRKHQPSVEVDREPSVAFDDFADEANGPDDSFDEDADSFDDDAFARAIREGRERDPEHDDGQKIA
jgi:hypothetical protein